MKKSRFRRRLIVLILALLLPVLGVSLGGFYWMASQALHSEICDRLYGAAFFAATQIDGDLHDKFVNAKNEQLPEYRQMQGLLANLQRTIPGLRFVVTAIPINDKQWRYVVDDMEMPSCFRIGNKTGVLDKDSSRYVVGDEETLIDLESNPTLTRALKGPVVDDQPYSDRYGTWFAAYAPFYRHDGSVAGVVEVDIDLGRLQDEQRILKIVAFSILGMALLLTVLLSFIVSGWVSRPIRQLMAGTQRIAEGDLLTPMHCDSPDEFGELADAFNDMCGRLDVAQKELVEKERYQQEMELASHIQLSMLPQDPPPSDILDISFHFQPLEEVGGDYYDLLMLGDGQLGIAIGDVAGHGLAAALLVCMAKSSLHTQASRTANVVDVMDSLNDMVYGALSERKFMTFFYSVLDTKTGTLSYSNAGHHYPYHYNATTDRTMQLMPSMYPLGVRQHVEYPIRHLQLGPEDILVFYSDGMIEAKNPAGEEYGFERFEAAIKTYHDLTAEGMRDAILAELDAFCDNQPAEDDRTILVVKVRP